MRTAGARTAQGFTLLEIIIVVAVAALLAGLALPNLAEGRAEGFRRRAIADLAMLAAELQGYSPLPSTLAEIGYDALMDPWGNPYQYHPIQGTGNGGFRKDMYLVPINSDFDLWSNGPDGMSAPPLTAQESRDDIVRANNGGFIGLATEY